MATVGPLDGGPTVTQLRALDLFCKAGGATKGLQRAGFHVTGVDIERQPRYCGDAFVQADALNPPFDLASFDFIWASPPCQAFTRANNCDALGRHKNLIPETRALLASSRTLTCIENVPGAPVRPDLVLDGTMFCDLKVIRKRLFELNFPVPFVLGFPTHDLVPNGWCSITDGNNSSHVRKARAKRGLRVNDTMEARRAAMGITWPMNRNELGNAIPPAYSEYIGRAAIDYIRHREAA